MAENLRKLILTYTTVFICFGLFIGGTPGMAQVTPDSPPLSADWRYFQYLTGENDLVFDAHICSTDSILHVYANNRQDIFHYTSIDNGQTWALLANENESGIYPWSGPVETYYGHNKFYTVYDVWEPSRNRHFLYFRSSTDFGQTWSWSHRLIVNENNQPGSDYNITGNGDTVFVLDRVYRDSPTYCILWRSYNSGNTWTRLNTPIRGSGSWNPPMEYDRSKGVLHVATILINDLDSSVVYYWKSTDNGDSWNQPESIDVCSDGIAWDLGMESDGLNNIAICWSTNSWSHGEHYGEFCRISHDDGNSWLPSIRIGEIPYKASDVTVSGNYVGVVWYEYYHGYYRLAYRESFDGGANWENVQEIARGRFCWSVSIIRVNEFIHIAFREDNSNARIGYVGYDPYTRTWGDIKEVLPSQISLSAYPNPFNSSTNISYRGLADGSSLCIYDIAGRLVREIQIDSQSGNVIWDAKDNAERVLSSGVYFVRASDSNMQSSLKIILLK